MSGEERKKQINFPLPEPAKHKIDELVAKLNADIAKAGHDHIPKHILYSAAVLKYLTDDLGWSDSMTWAKKKVAIDKFIEDTKTLVENFYNV